MDTSPKRSSCFAQVWEGFCIEALIKSEPVVVFCCSFDSELLPEIARALKRPAEELDH